MRQVIEPDYSSALAYQIKRGIDGRTRKISGRISRKVPGPLAFGQTQENGLQNIFSVGGAARYPVGRPKDAFVMRLKQCFQLAWRLFCRVANCSQWFNG